VSTECKSPSWTLSGWLTSLQIFSVISTEVLRPRLQGKTEAAWAKDASDEVIDSIIDEELLPRLRQRIKENWQKLKAKDVVCATELN
jgi:hypothetical protein